MIVSEDTTHEAILAVVRQVKPAHFEKVDLFDVFRGKNVPEGSKSVAYAFTYRSAEKTLTDQEVNPAHERVVAEFKQKLSAIVRE
jgi:phenylalanyl-tRNA synthetase beta chain